MEQINIEKKVQRQSRIFIKDFSTGTNQRASHLLLPKRGDMSQRGSFYPHYHLSQNKALFPTPSEGGTGGGCKGPPGSSGKSRGHPPENKVGPPFGQTPSNIEIQQFNKNQHTNFIHNLNFKIMKKQILFLAFLFLAAFANVNKSYGQCVADPLHPAAGVSYDYEVSVTGTGTSPVYNWLVTKDVNILAPTVIAAGTDFTVGVSAGFSTYNSAIGTTSKIQLAWTSAAVASATPYYLVVKYTATTSEGCPVENMRVWMIQPVNSFLLAVAGSDLAGVITNDKTCPANIDGALITAGASPTVAYTYGQNALYYKITASGSIGTWTPSISLPALAGLGQNYNNAQWTSDGGTTWNPFGLVDGDLDGGTFTSTVTTAPVSVAGSVIIVRILIDNVNWQTIAAQPIELGVDGVLPGGVKDIKTTADCTDELDFGKKGTYTITARPDVSDLTTDIPNPTNFITKAP